jgi:Ca2+/H+ antiporter
MQNNSEEERFRYQLALDIRKRADQSADYARALMLAVASGFTAYLVTKKELSEPELAALLFCGIAITLLAYSWFYQKQSSTDRYVILSEKSLAEYFDNERKRRDNPKKWNMAIDTISGVFLLAAALVVFFLDFAKSVKF